VPGARRGFPSTGESYWEFAAGPRGRSATYAGSVENGTPAKGRTVLKTGDRIPLCVIIGRTRFDTRCITGSSGYDPRMVVEV
jgi:hypothetical protein